MSSLNNETRLSGLGRTTVVNFVGTPRVKNHVKSYHGRHAFSHIEIEFIFAGKTFLHLNLCNLVKQSSNNTF